MEGIQTMGKLRGLVSGTRELLRQSPEFKRRAVHCLRHSWKVHAASKALAEAPRILIRDPTMNENPASSSAFKLAAESIPASATTTMSFTS